MARSLNEAKLIGHLGQDPELRYTGDGTAVCNLQIATDDTWTSGGEQKSKTEWHAVVAWEGLAEAVAEHLSKGERLYVEGRLETREWEDRDGNERETTKIHADEMIFLGDAGASGSPTGGQGQKQPAGSTAGDGPPDPSGTEHEFEPDDQLPF